MLKEIIDVCKESEDVIIVGKGTSGKKIWKLLRMSDVNVTAFCDNNVKDGEEICGGRVLPPEEAAAVYPEAVYVISIMNGREEAFDQLVALGISEANILHFYLRRTNEYYSKIPEEQYRYEIEERYLIAMERDLELDHPQRFTEKIQWLKLYDSSRIKTALADKYAVRDYVKDKVGENHLIPLLGVWDHFEEIDFDELPNVFVLKCNHGSAMNVIVKQKSAMDKQKIEQRMKKWLDYNWAFRNLELHYKEIEPKIIAEKYVEELDGNLFDYKVHCFNGKPSYIQVIGDRNPETHGGFQLVYDFDWNEQEWSFGDYPKYTQGLKRPSKLEELYQLSERLCADFEYVRIDFYIISDRILFGEMTFTPAAGIYSYNEDWKPETDLMMGEKLSLPDIINKH